MSYPAKRTWMGKQTFGLNGSTGSLCYKRSVPPPSSFFLYSLKSSSSWKLRDDVARRKQILWIQANASQPLALARKGPQTTRLSREICLMSAYPPLRSCFRPCSIVFVFIASLQKTTKIHGHELNWQATRRKQFSLMFLDNLSNQKFVHLAARRQIHATFRMDTRVI